ncbi:hypothetical protein OK016_15030 [Vibrio chagasii]|nr:hypothetical protein [Vibrio chagasii]
MLHLSSLLSMARSTPSKTRVITCDYLCCPLLIDKFFMSHQEGQAQTPNAAYKVNDVEMISKSALTGSTLAVVTAQRLKMKCSVESWCL